MGDYSDPVAEEQSPLNAKFKHIMEEFLDKYKVPGVSIGVVHGDKTFAQGYGTAKYPDQPVTPDTLFYTGCTTKGFTAAGISLLIDDREKYKDLDWTTPISHLARDDFVLSNSYWTEHITIEDGLCHRTGLPRHDKCYGGKDETPQSVTRRLRHLPFTCEPRTDWQYSNMMYIALSHAIELMTGESMGDFLATRLFRPLEMDSTLWTLKDAEASGIPLAKGYRWDEDKQEQVPVPYMLLREISGSGAIISNVWDYAKWLRTMINMGGPMSKKSHERMVKPIINTEARLNAEASAQFYGLGWMITWYRGEKVVFHPAGLTGFGAAVLYLPHRQWGTVMFGNSVRFAYFHEKIMWHLVDEFLGTPEIERIDWDKQKFAPGTTATKDSPDSTRAKYFPDAAADLPHALPLAAYTGTYTHPGYQSFTLRLNDSGALSADVPERVLRFSMEFEHVTREHFIVYVDKYEIGFKQVIKAEFTVGPQGKVTALGMAFKEYNNRDMIVFAKVE